jgi:hypothetical protein
VYLLLQNDKEFEAILAIDHTRGQYILMSDGWVNTERHYHPLIHLELRDNMIWLRCDNTDLEIGQELINEGVDKKDIIPAFYSPEMRKFVRL